MRCRSACTARVIDTLEAAFDRAVSAEMSVDIENLSIGSRHGFRTAFRAGYVHERTQASVTHLR